MGAVWGWDPAKFESKAVEFGETPWDLLGHQRTATYAHARWQGMAEPC